MSLKPKVEAVIYAAEEPVTLAQLVAIFSGEVLNDPAPAEGSGADPEGETSLTGNLLEAEAPDSHQTAPEDGAAVSQDAEAGTADQKKTARSRDLKVRGVLQGILDELMKDYANGQRGMEIREIAGGYRMATKPEYHDAVRSFIRNQKPPIRLSLQALETLAVIAYKQPVTSPEVSEIRGVDSSGVLGSLIARKLITTAGRKHVIGRPILYKTTKEFLLRFGLKDLSELPSMEEFEKMAGELARAEAEAEDAAMRSSDLSSTGAEPGLGNGGGEQELVEEGTVEPSADNQAEGEGEENRT